MWWEHARTAGAVQAETGRDWATLPGNSYFWRTGAGSPQIQKRAGEVWRITIWVVAIFTVFPWWWLSVLTRLSGGLPGNESEGMGGFLMMLFIGLPALALAILNETRLILNRHKPE